MGYLRPTPTEPRCPVCGDDGLLIGIDYPRYYRVTELDGKTVKAVSTGDSDEEGDNFRLFCSHCGEYFEPPENDNLEG